MRVLSSNKTIVFCCGLLLTLTICSNLPAQARPSYSKGWKHTCSASAGLIKAFCVEHTDNDDPWSKEELISPEELARSLSGERKPVIIQTGIIHLYKQAHIPGSRYTGPPAGPDGLQKLKKEVQDVPRTNEIVFYCGCCPWMDCPNIRPSYKALKEMGFKRVRVLYLPNSFTQDWVMKNLPVEKGGV